MKLPLLAASAVIAAAVCGSASAAVVTYSSYVASGHADISWVITASGVGSASFGGPDATYGGVSWEGSTANGHSVGETYVTVAGYNIYHSIPGTGWAVNNAGGYPTAPSITLLDNFSSLSGSGTIDINGLTAGQQYMAKFIFANSSSASNGQTMNLTSAAGNTGALGATQFAYSDGSFLVVTATWTADGPGDSFVPSLNGGSSSILNAVQVVAIPEASAVSLLGAVGVLGLLRRRR